VAVGHELLEDVGEVLGDAAEGADDGLVLLPVQVVHQRLDGRRARVQLLLLVVGGGGVEEEEDDEVGHCGSGWWWLEKGVGNGDIHD
jgi:hypothetical protein